MKRKCLWQMEYRIVRGDGGIMTVGEVYVAGDDLPGIMAEALDACLEDYATHTTHPVRDARAEIHTITERGWVFVV